MRAITVHRLSLRFDADQITHGSLGQQVGQAIAAVNRVLAQMPGGLAAELFANRDEIEIESSQSDEAEMAARKNAAAR